MHRDKSPVGDNTSNANALIRRSSDEILNASGVEKLDVGHLENLGHDGGGEESSVLDNHVVTLVLVGNTDLAEESISGLAHDHGGEELTSEPSTTTRRHGSLDDGDLEIGTLLAQDVSSAKTAGSCADDDNVGLGVGVEVLEVATSHSARDLALADGGELEVIPVTEHLLNGLGVDVLARVDRELGRSGGGSKLSRAGRGRNSSRGRHVWEPIVVRHLEVPKEEDMILSLVLSRSSFAV
jgi:hypothetical protein